MTIMKRGYRHIPVGEFKAHCLRLLAQVQTTGEVLIVTKRGIPMARIAPADDEEKVPLKGSVKIIGDIIAPINETWDVES